MLYKLVYVENTMLKQFSNGMNYASVLEWFHALRELNFTCYVMQDNNAIGKEV